MTSKVIKETYLLSLPYCGSTHSIVQYFDDGSNKVLWSGGKSVQEYLAEYTGKPLTECTGEQIDDLESAFAQSLMTEPVEIDFERFDDMLCCLPPSRWNRFPGLQYFHISENLRGSLVSWFAKIGERYFEFTDTCNASDDYLIAKIRRAGEA